MERNYLLHSSMIEKTIIDLKEFKKFLEDTNCEQKIYYNLLALFYEIVARLQKMKAIIAIGIVVGVGLIYVGVMLNLESCQLTTIRIRSSILMINLELVINSDSDG